MTKISTLPADNAPSSDDYIVVNDSTSGQTKKVLLSDLATLILPDAIITSRKFAPTAIHNNDAYNMQSNSVETVKSTISIASQPVDSVVFLMAVCSAGIGNGAPTLNVETKIRRTNTSGTTIYYSQDTKAAATGVTERRTWTLAGMDALPASTARDYVLTDASNIGATVTCNFMAIVINDDNVTFV